MERIVIFGATGDLAARYLILTTFNNIVMRHKKSEIGRARSV